MPEMFFAVSHGDALPCLLTYIPDPIFTWQVTKAKTGCQTELGFIHNSSHERLPMDWILVAVGSLWLFLKWGFTQKPPHI
jgi:hypothetical protein